MALTNAEKQAAWRKRREQRIVDLEGEVADLRARLVKSEVAAKHSDGSLFDWNKDKPDEIAATLAGSKRRKARELWKSLGKVLNLGDKPAG